MDSVEGAETRRVGAAMAIAEIDMVGRLGTAGMERMERIEGREIAGIVLSGVKHRNPFFTSTTLFEFGVCCRDCCCGWGTLVASSTCAPSTSLCRSLVLPFRTEES
jgi:hypothetical protein